MKYFITLLLCLSFIYCFGSTSLNKDSIENRKIEKLNEDLQKTKRELIDKTIITYQQTNDRLNNYLTFTGIVATVFGVIIALGGIWVGFESLRSQKKRDEAIRTLEEAKNYVEGKKLDFDSAIQKKLTELENDYKKIIEISKERLLLDINNETLYIKEIAEKKSQEIEEFSIKETRDKSIESLQKRLDFFENIGIPDDPKILLSKAKLLKEKGMFQEAIELLLKVAIKEPNNFDTYWELGWNYAKLDDKIKSIENYQKSIKLKDNSSAHNNLGVLYESQEKLYDSLQEYDCAIKLEPAKKLYYRNKAKIFLKLNSIDLAIEVYKSVIILDGSDLASYQDLIKLFQKQNRGDDALEYYDLAILNVPDKATELNYTKALYLYQIEKRNEALTLIQNLLVLNYKTEECLQISAQIKLDLGEKEEALRILDSINELNIKNPFPYIKKAEILFDENPNSSMSIIEEGLKHIHDFGYLLNSSRVFSKNKSKEFAKKLQLKAIRVLKSKIDSHEESDIMNLYETYIIVEDFSAAKKIILENHEYIKSAKYVIVSEFLSICLKLLEKIPVDFKIEIEKFKYLKNLNTEKIPWVFTDITYYIDSKGQDEIFKSIHLLISYLKDEITIDGFITSL